MVANVSLKSTLPKVAHITAVCVNNSRHESSGLSCVTASLLHPTCCSYTTPRFIHTLCSAAAQPPIDDRESTTHPVPCCRRQLRAYIELGWQSSPICAIKNRSNFNTSFHLISPLNAASLVSEAGLEITGDNAVNVVCYICHSVENGLAGAAVLHC